MRVSSSTVSPVPTAPWPPERLPLGECQNSLHTLRVGHDRGAGRGRAGTQGHLRRRGIAARGQNYVPGAPSGNRSVIGAGGRGRLEIPPLPGCAEGFMGTGLGVSLLRATFPSGEVCPHHGGPTHRHCSRPFVCALRWVPVHA